MAFGVPEFFIQALVSVPVALLTSFITIKLTFRKYKSEKWFEKRFDAYIKVIESLHFMKSHIEKSITAFENGFELQKSVKDKLWIDYSRGADDLARLSDMGSLLFTAGAEKILITLDTQLSVADEEESWYEHIYVKDNAVGKALREFRAIAKKDLSGNTFKTLY